MTAEERNSMPDEFDGSQLLWFIAGAAVGASVALLYAPAAGHQTRKYLSEHTVKSGQALSESGKEMLEKGRELYEQGRKLAEEAADLFEKGRKLAEGAAHARS